MSDQDLSKVDKAEVIFDKYVNLLQVKYVYTREHAKKRIDRRLAEIEVDKKTTAHLPGPAD